MRLYRLLLCVYPRWFRDRYRAELVEAFVAERQAPRFRGRAGGLRFWLHVACDLWNSTYRVRRSTRRAVRADAPGRTVMDALTQDLRYAFRQLAHRPGFTAVAVLSLAIGIGANAAIFAFVDGFVFHPFAYPEPDRLVTVGSTFPRLSNEERFIEAISIPEFLDIRRVRTVTSLAAFDLGNRNLSGGDRPERVFTALAVTDLFAPFGLRPALGRGFTDEELAPRGPEVAIISYRLWQSRFGGDPSMIGRDVRVNGRPTTVVGIMPAELLLLGTDLWVPLAVDLGRLPRNGRQFTVIGRLAPAASLSEANAELASVAGQTATVYEPQFEEYRGWRLSAVPFTIALMRDIRPGMRLLLGAVGLVLLIACLNLSNLLLARSTTRQREVAVRLALGSGRLGIARQLAAEVALIALVGGGAGFLLAYVGLPALVSLVPASANTIGILPAISARVLVWAAATTIGAALVVALLPVFQATRTSPQDVLRSEGRGATQGRVPVGLRHLLIVLEIALSVILLVGAGLFVRSFANLRHVEPGFDPDNVLTMRLTAPQEKYRGAAVNTFFQQILDRLEETPGVRSVSAASQFPPNGVFTTPLRLEGAPAPSDTLPTTLVTAASEHHFATLGVPMTRGRGFTADDRVDTPPVAIVNEAFVSRFLPGLAPVGQRLSVGPPERLSPLQIVGVVANTQNRDLRNPPSPELFIPLSQQHENNQLFLLIRTEGDAAAMLPAVRREIATVDPDQPIYAIRTLEDALAADLFRSRFSMLLLAVFAAIALALAAIGIYGVMSYAVSARTQEIGVRLAVGADRRDVLWLVQRQVLRLTAIGLAIGLAGVMAGGTAIRQTLYEVQPLDPITVAATAVLLGAVALLAGWLPAWRASRVDPVQALRCE